MFLDTVYPGVYCIEHIIYLIVWALIFVSSFILLKKIIKTDKQKTYFIKGIALILLISIIINRISVTYHNYKYDGRSIIEIIPYTFCAMSSLVLSIAVIFGKKDNIILHAVCYSALIGGAITSFYPDFLETQTFWDIRSFSGLMHHTLDLFLVVMMLKTAYFRPSIKKWYCYPIGICIAMTFGLFEKDALNFAGNPMLIHSSLLSSLPVFTSWYVVAFLSIVIEIIIILLYEFITKKLNKKNA